MSSWTVVRRWLLEEALPLWAEAGYYKEQNAFAERLSLQGIAIRNQPRRLMVQARQIYSFAKAERHRWMSGAAELVSSASRSMVESYYQSDGTAGWVMSVDSDGRVLDCTRDLYAHSFVLLGLASAFASTRDEQYLSIIDQTLSFMDNTLAHQQGGYLPFVPNHQQPILTQNPHMHLLEALLAIHEVAPKDEYRIRSAKIVKLLETSLFRPRTSILSEYFDSSWTPVLGDKGSLFEPGHHYEWIWLLRRYSTMFNEPLSFCFDELDRTVTLHGCSEAGLLWNEVRDDGFVIDASFRLWPHTEAIKAALAKADYDAADSWLSILYRKFLHPAYSGGWNDRLDSQGGSLLSYMPASSLYHLVCAFSEMEDAMKLTL